MSIRYGTGVRLSNGCGGVAYTPPENIRRASVGILKSAPPALRGRRVFHLVDAATAGPFAGVIRLATLNALSASSGNSLRERPDDVA